MSSKSDKGSVEQQLVEAHKGLKILQEQSLLAHENLRKLNLDALKYKAALETLETVDPDTSRTFEAVGRAFVLKSKENLQESFLKAQDANKIDIERIQNFSSRLNERMTSTTEHLKSLRESI